MHKIGLIFILGLLMACRGQKVKPGQWPKDRISFGNNGGFTSAQQRFELFENGQVFYISGLDTAEQKRLKRKQTKLIFAEADKLYKSGIKENKLGNMTNFINYTHDTIFMNWQWPTSGIKSVPNDLSPLNQLLLKAVQSK